MMDSLQISEKGWPWERSTSTVAIMVATYTPAVKGCRGMASSRLLALTRVPTSCAGRVMLGAGHRAVGHGRDADGIASMRRDACHASVAMREPLCWTQTQACSMQIAGD